MNQIKNLIKENKELQMLVKHQAKLIQVLLADYKAAQVAKKRRNDSKKKLNNKNKEK